MSLQLNGWRRLGVVAATLWLLGVIAIAVTEYTSKSNGFFVSQTIPVGTAIQGNTVTLPDGKVITITEEEEFELRRSLERKLGRLKAGQPINPWKIDWSKVRGVPKTTEIRWLRLVSFGLLTPMFVWLITEATALIVAWVKRGFIGRASN